MDTARSGSRARSPIVCTRSIRARCAPSGPSRSDGNRWAWRSERALCGSRMRSTGRSRKSTQTRDGRSPPSRSVAAPPAWPWVRARCGWRVEAVSRRPRWTLLALTCLTVVAVACGGSSKQSSVAPVRIGAVIDCSDRGSSELSRAGAELPLLAHGAKLRGALPSDGVTDAAIAKRTGQAPLRVRAAGHSQQRAVRTGQACGAPSRLTLCWDHPARTMGWPSVNTHGTTPRPRSC